MVAAAEVAGAEVAGAVPDVGAAAVAAALVAGATAPPALVGAAAAALVAAAAAPEVVAALELLPELLPHAARDMADTSPSAASRTARCVRTEIPFHEARPRGRGHGADAATLAPTAPDPKGGR